MSKEEKKEPKFDPSWKVRRSIVFCTLIFGAAVIVYLLGWGANNRLNETIASGTLFLCGSVIMAYTGLAVWDDKNKALGK